MCLLDNVHDVICTLTSVKNKETLYLVILKLNNYQRKCILFGGMFPKCHMCYYVFSRLNYLSTQQYDIKEIKDTTVYLKICILFQVFLLPLFLLKHMVQCSVTSVQILVTCYPSTHLILMLLGVSSARSALIPL